MDTFGQLEIFFTVSQITFAALAGILTVYFVVRITKHRTRGKKENKKMTKKNQMKKYVGLLEKRLKSISCMIVKRMDAMQIQIDALERILSPDGLSATERESAPFRIGDPVWWVNRTEGKVECEPNGVFGVFFRDGHWYTVNRDLDIDLVGSDMALPTRAEAERRLYDGKTVGEGV